MWTSTVPPRLALMCADATSEVKLAVANFRQTLDELDRPAIYIEVGAGDYPATAAGILNGEGIYIVNVIGHKYGLGSIAAGEYENEARRVTDAVVKYIWQRQQLQFSNALQRAEAPLGSLDGVEWVALHREGVGLMTHEALSEQVWGAVITVTVKGIEASAPEVLVFPDRAPD